MERRFRLQPVLRYRQDVEDSLQLQLSSLLYEEQVARARLAELQAGSDSASEGVLAFQRHRLPDLPIIEQGILYLEVMAGEIALQDQRLAEIAERVTAKRAELVEAMQRRKTMEKLKERHEAAYRLWAQRVEDRAIDDATTMRFNRTNREAVAS